MDSHLRYFTRGWYFSLPWLVINGGLAGYTAYSLVAGDEKSRIIINTEISSAVSKAGTLDT